MVKRKRAKKRSKVTRKRAKRRTTRRKVARKKTSPASVHRKAVLHNWRAQMEAFKELKKKTDKAWAKLRADVKRKASPVTILQDRDNLLLLLGECNYMAGECRRIAHRR